MALQKPSSEVGIRTGRGRETGVSRVGMSEVGSKPRVLKSERSERVRIAKRPPLRQFSLFASGDSKTSARFIPVAEKAIWPKIG